MDEAWRLTTSPLLWREWDGDIVVYNDASGDTHRLDALAAEAFEILLETPAGTDDLIGRVAQSLATEVTPELSEALTAVIWQLQGFGLIVQVSP